MVVMMLTLNCDVQAGQHGQADADSGQPTHRLLLLQQNYHANLGRTHSLENSSYVQRSVCVWVGGVVGVVGGVVCTVHAEVNIPHVDNLEPSRVPALTPKAG